jgi:hypothetical protein
MNTYQCKPTNQSILGIGRTYIDLQGKEHFLAYTLIPALEYLGKSIELKKVEKDRSMSPVKAYLIKALALSSYRISKTQIQIAGDTRTLSKHLTLSST